MDTLNDITEKRLWLAATLLSLLSSTTCFRMMPWWCINMHFKLLLVCSFFTLEKNVGGFLSEIEDQKNLNVHFNVFIHPFCVIYKLNTYWSHTSPRWLRGDLLDDRAGVDVCAPDVGGGGVDALHPGGSQFRPSDGHGDRSLRVAHG